MSKFWVLMRDNKVVYYRRWSMGGGYNTTKFDSLESAERHAKTLTKKYNQDITVMESVSYVTVPTTVVKID